MPTYGDPNHPGPICFQCAGSGKVERSRPIRDVPCPRCDGFGLDRRLGYRPAAA